MPNIETLLNQKTAQLAAVREISRAIAEAQDLDSTLDLITRRTAEVMRVDSCSIYLYNDTQDKLILAASTGLNQDGIGLVYLPHGAGLTGWAAENREGVAVTDAFADARFYRVAGSGEGRFRSLMAMPLVAHGKVIGAVNVQTRQQHEFTEDEVELFNFITELAATALEKVQLVHTATVQEMHHRVKNNLQTVAMLLRLQAQYPNLSPQDILKETINRILSIATVHEILSEAGVDKVGLLDLIKRLTTTIASNMVNPQANINITVQGDNVELAAQKATSLALVVNELVQNALEHGLAEKSEGQIIITIAVETEPALSLLSLTVCDDGRGLPENFNLATDLNLGLNIVQATIMEDLHGTFHLRPRAEGTGVEVKITIPLEG